MIQIDACIIVSLYLADCRPSRYVPMANGQTYYHLSGRQVCAARLVDDDTVSATVHAWPTHQRTRTMTFLRGARRLGLALLAAAAAQLPAGAAELNDYPTAARADYVFACMKTNGDTRQALEKCSCSIDVIASILPYDRYVAAETVLSLSQVPGRFGAMFHSPEQAKAAINDLRRAQAEGEVRCF
jgi:hypothetical protein